MSDQKTAPASEEPCPNCQSLEPFCGCRHKKASDGVGMRAVVYMANCMAMPDSTKDQEQNWILGHLATFAMEERDAQAEQLAALPLLKAREQVMFDLHEALGVPWGSDPYLRILSLKAAEATLAEREQQLATIRILVKSWERQAHPETSTWSQEGRDVYGICADQVSEALAAVPAQKVSLTAPPGERENTTNDKMKT
jgi:hypothetical protein